MDTIEFILIFIILAFFWLLAFQLLRWMKVVDMTYVYLALFELLVIVFIPITSSLFTFFSEEANISIAFALNIILCGLILIIQWYYLSRETSLLTEEAADEIKTAERKYFLGRRVAIMKMKEKRNSFIEIRNRLFILPVASLIWLVLNIGEMNFSLIPALLGVCYLIFISWD